MSNKLFHLGFAAEELVELGFSQEDVDAITKEVEG